MTFKMTFEKSLMCWERSLVCRQCGQSRCLDATHVNERGVLDDDASQKNKDELETMDKFLFAAPKEGQIQEQNWDELLIIQFEKYGGIQPSNVIQVAKYNCFRTLMKNIQNEPNCIDEVFGYIIQSGIIDVNIRHDNIPLIFWVAFFCTKDHVALLLQYGALVNPIVYSHYVRSPSDFSLVHAIATNSSLSRFELMKMLLEEHGLNPHVELPTSVGSPPLLISCFGAFDWMDHFRGNDESKHKHMEQSIAMIRLLCSHGVDPSYVRSGAYKAARRDNPQVGTWIKFMTLISQILKLETVVKPAGQVGSGPFALVRTLYIHTTLTEWIQLHDTDTKKSNNNVQYVTDEEVQISVSSISPIALGSSPFDYIDHVLSRSISTGDTVSINFYKRCKEAMVCGWSTFCHKRQNIRIHLADIFLSIGGIVDIVWAYVHSIVYIRDYDVVDEE